MLTVLWVENCTSKTLNQFNALWEWDFASILSNDKLSDVRIATQAVFWLLSILSFAIVFCLVFLHNCKKCSKFGQATSDHFVGQWI